MSRLAATLLAVPAVLLGLSLSALEIRADTAGCQALCSVRCLKPIACIDRWDDVTAIPGHYEWVGNGYFDREPFSDSNHNRRWDPGEPYVDENSDGIYNEEVYDPEMTGYMAEQDLGTQLLFKLSSNYKPLPFHLWAIDLPTGDYSWSWANCEPEILGVGDTLSIELVDMSEETFSALLALQEQDPSAIWDASCNCVTGSDSAESPRLFIAAATDPRTPPYAFQVTKLLTFFLEASALPIVTVRLAHITSAQGEVCGGPPEVDGGFVSHCDPVQVEATTWGRIKSHHR